MSINIDELFLQAKKQSHVRKGFTLAEMMVVMLIMTIVLAMAAPLMTKRRLGDNNAIDSPWAWVQDSPVDAYFKGGNSGVAMIGQTSKDDGSNIEKNARLIISQGSGNGKYPIVFKRGNSDYLNLAWNNYNLRFGGPYENTPTSNYNTSFGIGSMNKNSVTGSNNTAFGYNSLSSATSGINNVAVGSSALKANTQGGGNVAVGYDALAANTQESGNVAVGRSALSANTKGYTNVAVGYYALANNLSGVVNTAIGAYSLQKNTEGKDNIAVGFDALINNTKGSYNVAVGGSSLSANTTGDNNTAIGNSALWKNVSGGWNVAIGKYAASKLVSGNSNVVIGNNAAPYLESGSNIIAIGDSACNHLTSGANKTCIGVNSGPAEGSALAADNTYKKVIFLGDSSTTVYIPGHLVVDGNVLLAAGSSKEIFTKFSNTVGKLTGSDASAVTFTTATPTDTQIPIYSAIYSDKRLKNISGENKVGLDKIRELRVFNFTFKKDKSKTPHVGVIAQDLENIFPDAVTKDDDGYLMIRMEDMFYSAINAIKELDNFVQGILNELKIVYAKITGLDTRIQTLEKENKQLKDANKKLEKQISDINNRLKKLEK